MYDDVIELMRNLELHMIPGGLGERAAAAMVALKNIDELSTCPAQLSLVEYLEWAKTKDFQPPVMLALLNAAHRP